MAEQTKFPNTRRGGIEMAIAQLHEWKAAAKRNADLFQSTRQYTLAERERAHFSAFSNIIAEMYKLLEQA